MKIISIDPGYERLGVAILDQPAGRQGKNNNKEELIFSDCIQTDKSLSHSERLSIIKESLEEVIEKYKPEVLAIETLFFNKNQKTAMAVAEARGTIISTCSSKNIKVFELSPLQIKMAVTGNGKSDKNSVMKMVPLLIDIKKEIKYDDEYDAIATGLAYFALEKNIHN